MSEKIKKCLIPKCENEARVRGLCKHDYAATNRLINAGILDIKKLERIGVLLPKSSSYLHGRSTNIINFVSECENKSIKNARK